MRALVEIALNGDEPTSLKLVADRQKISQHYLEQIIAVLRRAGIVESLRGAYGGYRLARPMNQITALEVVELMEGTVAPVACIDDETKCEHTGQCTTEGLWQRVDQAVRNVLQNTTLADLVRERDLLQLEPLPEQFTQAN
jgi:Rrf2 family cysteine metabolism transcriptional repressor